jgi:hypothetical protein
MEVNDLLLDSNQELVATTSGDFRTGDASNNLIKYIIISHIGNWKEFPLVGVGVDEYLNSNISADEIETEIKSALQADIFRNPVVDASGFPPTIDVNKTTIDAST